MKTKTLKRQITGFLAISLFLAMLLISLVWGMFLKNNMVEKEIARLDDVVDLVAARFRAGDLPMPVSADLLDHHNILCLHLETGAGQIVLAGKEGCFLDQVRKEMASEAGKKNGRAIAYHGTSWAAFTFSHAEVLVGKALRDGQGNATGTVIVGASLAPVYARIRQESAVVLFYIIINTIIFAGIGLLRMIQLVVKPIDQLIARSQQYTPNAALNFLPEAANNEFASLSLSLTQLFGRIREDNEKLRSTVALLETANAELERNKKEMVRTEKLAAIGRLSAGLAHEIGNPLSIIMGYAELLGRTDLTDQERAQFSQNSQTELERIKALIRQLLDFARPTTVPAQQLSVNGLIREVLGLVGVEKSFAHCTIIEQLDATRDWVYADADGLRQVFLNCLLNAADSMTGRENCGEISVATGNSTTGLNQQVVYIRIRDSGSGIAEENLEKVFEPFYTTKGPGQGTGLGLFVCHTIIERLGGAIVVGNHDAGSGGAEIVITLPSSEPPSTPVN